MRKKIISFSLFMVVGCLSASLSTSTLFADEVREQDSATVKPATPPVEKVDATAPGDDRADYLPFVTGVETQGTQIVSPSVIMNQVKIRRGQQLSRELINKDIKRLYASGYFRDVKVDLIPDGNDFKVVFIVDEKPVISEINITGNTEIRVETLLKDVALEVGAVVDRKKLKEGVRKIEERYKKKGFRFIFIQDNVVIDESKKQAKVVIEINEGKKFRIKEVTFRGNAHLSDKKLRKIMQTKKKRFLRKGSFDELIFEDDIDRIKFFYQKEGYLDVEIEPVVNYDNEGNRIYVEMIITENKQYTAGEVQIEGNKLFPTLELSERLVMVSGKQYSPTQLSDDLNNLRRFYFEKGHINANIQVETNLNKETGQVDLFYSIVEDEVYYVDKIRIRGNTKTRDNVIRRELRIHPGERFDGEKLERSKKRLEDLGYFETVAYETEPGTDRNMRDVVVRVQERKTGELSFGGGVSSVESFLGFVELSQRNFDYKNWPSFTGDGQQFSVKARWGQLSQDIDVSFYEPHWFDSNYSFGFNIYNFIETTDVLDFDTHRRGANITIGREFLDTYRAAVSYGLERVKLDEISPDASASVLSTRTPATLSKLKASLSTNKLDSRIRPTKGYFSSVSAELVGGALGGDEDYYRLQGRYNHYWTVFKTHLIEFKNRLGFVNEYGDSNTVPIYDRLYAGGLGTVRGFGFKRVGPKEAGNPVGGESLWVSSIEYQFPLWDNFKGAFFIDAGHVSPDFFDIEFDEVSASVGPGLLINTPIGPIAFYYGYPIYNEDDSNKNGRFEFSFSRGF